MDLALPSLLLFDRTHGAQPARGERMGVQDARKTRLYCAQCRHAITDQDERVAKQGSAEHTFANPYGMVFSIACFRKAPGCAASGAPTSQHTWFAGYAWRIAICARCSVHLGWAYTSAGDGFYGLIVDRLSADSAG